MWLTKLQALIGLLNAIVNMLKVVCKIKSNENGYKHIDTELEVENAGKSKKSIVSAAMSKYLKRKSSDNHLPK